MSFAIAYREPYVKGLNLEAVDLVYTLSVTEANYKLPRTFKQQISQVELKQQIESLSDELKKISEVQQCPLELDLYVRKLLNAKLKITVVSNILQTAQERLNKVHQMIARESARRKTLLEPSPSCSPLEVSHTSIQ
uniref:Biogenesis of lysosome-related organelles complex 1 subunit 7 n=1 Tax=Timema tahoe TaxID=61484 RepID=A0A7R9FMF1_9NEOP|nr:unnamed protein product [Timema tahoe]